MLGVRKAKDSPVQVLVVTLLAANTICAVATWFALVSDGLSRLTPATFARGFVSDVKTYGAWKLVLAAIVCFFAWWLILLAWFASEYLEPRR